MNTKLRTKLSLESFKAKLSNNERQRNLDKIVGGIMGQCHCVVVDTFTYYNGNTVNTYTFYLPCKQ